jgi:5,10-methylenetetrahydrofolate reductase
MSLKDKLEAGTFAVLAEMEPPKGTDVSAMMENARMISEKADAFVVSEMGNAVMRMSALAGAVLLKQQGMEPVLQVCCRDRNRLALQADILGAFACGIDTIMVVPGEAPTQGDHHQTKAVDDISPVELLDVLHTLQEGRDMAGAELLGAPRFLTGAALIIPSEEAEVRSQLELMAEQMEAGAAFFITQPIFDLNLLGPFLSLAREKEAALIPTVLLLKSLGMARYMQRNVKNIHISDELIKRLQKSKDKTGECILLASELVSGIRQAGCRGVVLSGAGGESFQHLLHS